MVDVGVADGVIEISVSVGCDVAVGRGSILRRLAPTRYPIGIDLGAYKRNSFLAGKG